MLPGKSPHWILNKPPYLLDRVSVFPRFAYSVSHRLNGTAFVALRVRRASDNTELDIGFAGNLVDEDQIASFCAGTNGFVRRVYDQAGFGRTMSQNGAANQPKIYDSVTGIVRGTHGYPAMLFDGSNDYLECADSGFSSGNPAYSIIVDADPEFVGGGDRPIWMFNRGFFANNSALWASFFSDGRRYLSNVVTNARIFFTGLAPTDGPTYLLAQKPAGGNVGTQEARERGVQLAVHSTVSPTQNLNLAVGGNFLWGILRDNSTIYIAFEGRSATLLGWEADLLSPDQVVLENWFNPRHC